MKKFKSILILSLLVMVGIYLFFRFSKGFFKPSQYASNPKVGQTWFEKYFPNVAEVKDMAVNSFKKGFDAIPFVPNFFSTPKVATTKAAAVGKVGR